MRKKKGRSGEETEKSLDGSEGSSGLRRKIRSAMIKEKELNAKGKNSWFGRGEELIGEYLSNRETLSLLPKLKGL